MSSKFIFENRILLWLEFNTFLDQRSVDKQIINVIRMNGVIASGSKFPGSSNLSLESLEKQIERAFSGKKIAGVALIINSPGGSPVQSALISERIVELSSKNNIPVFAFVEDVAASGGYWLACSADEIFVMPASIVGSIGVISAGFGFVDVIKKSSGVLIGC